MFSFLGIHGVFFLWTLLLLCCLNVNSYPEHQHDNKAKGSRTILVFGGNGFIGAATVTRLLDAGHSVTLVNRGNWYWDSDMLIKPFVHHLRCDRMQSLYRCDDMNLLLTSNPSIFFDTVIDFSAYHQEAVSDVMNILQNRIGFYVLISTDSVYEVCIKNHFQPTRESDAVRPTNEALLKEYNQKDDYGNRKLQCEEILTSQSGSNIVPYIIYRLPDVIGPRDNTYRWWIYQSWMRLRKYLERPVSIPDAFVNKPMSLVYVEDVADIIVKYMFGGEGIQNEVYNLALAENPTLMDFLTDIKNALNLTNLDIIVEPLTSNSVYLFPSVKFGPIDISKAVKLLKWNPTPWNVVVKKNINFYERAMTLPKYEIARRDIIRMIQTYLTRRPYQVLSGLKNEYEVEYPFKKDEL